MKNGHIKIQRGIPLPKATATTGNAPSPFTLALGTMKLGESFWVKRDPQKASRAAYMWRLRGDVRTRRFAFRKERGGVRVWRVK